IFFGKGDSLERSHVKEWDAKARQFHERYGQYVPATAFLAGLIFDSIALERIDDSTTLVLQAGYLFVICFLLLLDYRLAEDAPVNARFRRLWEYRAELKHFLLGSLLSAYTVFYFKSASLWPSFFFFGLIVACLL